MKIIESTQTNEFKNSDNCIAIEYPLNDKDINLAIIKLKARYPDKGSAINKRCKEIAYINKGKGQVTINGLTKRLSKGDVVFIDKGEKYFWNGNMEMVMPCTPAWNPEQHSIVD